MTQSIEYTRYSRQFAEWASPAHVIMHEQFSSGVTKWQRKLMQVMFTSRNRGISVNRCCARRSQKFAFVLSVELFR